MSNAGAARRRAEISRRDTELFQRLDSGLNRSRLAVIKAPPGSGKTTLLLRLVASAVRSGSRVAVAAQTNAQVDDICARLAALPRPVRVCRFSPRSSQARDLGWVTSPSAIPSVPVAAVSTTAKWSLTDLKEDSTFAVLFVDEAWQMAWGDFMLLAGTAERFALIGDPGQIPPVVTIPVDRWETSPRAPHVAAPEIILADPSLRPITGELPACRRLPAGSVELVRPFYGNFHFDAWAEPEDRAVAFGRRPRNGAAYDPAVDLLTTGSVGVATLPTPKDGPPFERDEEIADLAAALVVRLLDRRPTAAWDDRGVAEPLTAGDIGVCATHRVMNAAIDAALPAPLRRHVKVDTAERWQGLQRKVMIVVHPLSGSVHPSDFDLETGRLCVMASRHQSGLLILARDHVRQTLEEHIPSAGQALGRPDIAGRGHHQHLAFWSELVNQGRVVALAP